MPPTDRRVRRTREALQRAMVELIREKGFEATTIAEIAERADVGRSTFYAHYADKEDLLKGAAEMLQLHIQSQIDLASEDARTGVHPALAFCRPMLEHAAEARDLFLAMLGRRSGYLFQELVHDMWVGFVRRGWPGADELAVQAVAGAFGATITWWLMSAPELGPAEVDGRFRALLGPVVGAAVGGAAPRGSKKRPGGTR